MNALTLLMKQLTERITDNLFSISSHSSYLFHLWFSSFCSKKALAEKIQFICFDFCDSFVDKFETNTQNSDCRDPKNIIETLAENTCNERTTNDEMDNNFCGRQSMIHGIECAFLHLHFLSTLSDFVVYRFFG